MRRKRRSGAGDDEIAEVLLSCGFPRACGIWFTVPFRETITIAAIKGPGRCVSRHWRVRRNGSGLFEATQEDRTLSGTRKLPAARCAAGGQINNIRGLGSWERHATSAVGAKNEGVGEHVRIRFHLGLKTTRALRPPAKLRIMRSAPNEENLFLLPDRFSKERTLLKERSSRLT